MKAEKVKILLMLMPVVLQASEFPYGTGLADRFEATSEMTVSEYASVPKIGDVAANDTVVTSSFEVDLKAVDEEDWPELPADLQFGLTVVKPFGGESCIWKGFVDGKWVDLEGVAAEEGKWIYQIDIDKTQDPTCRKVRYGVKRDGEAEYAFLHEKGSSETWLSVGASAPDGGTAVEFYGKGSVSSAVLKSGQRQSEATVATVEDCSMDNTKLTLELDIADVWGADTLTVELKQGDVVEETVNVTPLAAGKRNVVLNGLSSGTYTYQIKLSGTYKGADLASAKDAVTVTLATPKMTLKGNTIVLSSNAEVDMANTAAGSYAVSSAAGKKCHLKWTDANGKYAVMSEGTLTVKEGQPKNGMDSYESYVLGLNPTVESSKPYITSKQNDEADKFTFELGNVTPKSESETGVAVSYDLIASTDPTFATAKTTLATATENQLSCGLPSDKVTYYKIEINMK